MTLSLFQKEKKEGRGAYWAKVGIMGVILPTFNLIELIVTFIKVEQNRETLGCGTTAFISYFVANTLLLVTIGKEPEPEDHELREDNSKADN